jgi:transmembrane sensor
MPGKKIKNQLLYIIKKYAEGEASKEEIEFLNLYYEGFEKHPEILGQKTAAEKLALKAEMEAQIIDRILFQNKKKKAKIVFLPASKGWYKVAVAASVILLASLAFYFLKPTSSKQIAQKTSTEYPLKNDIAPGGNKAILTLADGSHIILDSANNGTLSQQGTIKIIKLNDGELAYATSAGENKGEILYNTISTPKGGQYQLILSDGSRVWLNAASSLRFPTTFSGNERKVDLIGEGYFEVTKNKDKPFKVSANNTIVEVLGTHFNINAYNDEPFVKTTLLEGMVKVSTPLLPGNSSPKFLLPGQQAGVSKNGEITLTENADMEEAVAWKNGLFQFKSSDIKTVLRQIARWYDVDVEYVGDVNLHFTGQLTRNENVSKVFKELALTGEVHFKIDGKKIIVSP